MRVPNREYSIGTQKRQFSQESKYQQMSRFEVVYPGKVKLHGKIGQLSSLVLRSPANQQAESSSCLLKTEHRLAAWTSFPLTEVKFVNTAKF